MSDHFLQRKNGKADYHLLQRKRKNGKVVLYAAIPNPDQPGKYLKMIQLQTDPALSLAMQAADRGEWIPLDHLLEILR